MAITKKIFHIVVDDKFIDGAVEKFEKIFPGGNEFMCFCNDSEVKYIKSVDVKFVSPSFLDDDAFFNMLKKYKVLIFHWLSFYSLKIIEKLYETDVKICWIGWGGDYYDIITSSEDDSALMLDETLSIFREYQNIIESKNIAKKKLEYNNIGFLAKFKRKMLPNRYRTVVEEKFLEKKKRLIKRIDYFAPVIYEDYLMVKNSINDFSAEFCSLNYGITHDRLTSEHFKDIKVNGNNILVGNSATFTNNHIEVFKKLKDMGVKDRKIIVPLSYGDDYYKNVVISEGRKCFGNDFKPLCEFVDIGEYVRLISSCSVAIMNHLRQQALGNIIIMLYLGAQVFVRDENPLKRFFNRNEIETGSINTISFLDLNNMHCKSQKEKISEVFGNTEKMFEDLISKLLKG